VRTTGFLPRHESKKLLRHGIELAEVGGDEEEEDLKEWWRSTSITIFSPSISMASSSQVVEKMAKKTFIWQRNLTRRKGRGIREVGRGAGPPALPPASTPGGTGDRRRGELGGS
jgi:hypothetical protein